MSSLEKNSSTIQLEVPRPVYSDLHGHTGIIVGMATDAERLHTHKQHMQHWLRGGHITLIMVVSPSPEIETLEKEWQEEGLKAHFIQSNKDFRHRYMSLLSEMYKAAKEHPTQIKWLGIIDDDTFIPSMYRLSYLLSHYDHTVPFWLGATSEHREVMCDRGIYAYGGAGMFFSLAMLRDLQPILPQCMDRDWGKRSGDLAISVCIYDNTRERLTNVRDLHQLDMVHGTFDGLYESGWKPASIHHWLPRSHLPNLLGVPMAKVAQVAHVAGDESLFQRWSFEDGWVLTNSFSLVKYNVPLEEIDFAKTEMTWKADFKDFQHSLGPFRGAMKPEEKESFLFTDSVVEGNKVRQIYVRHVKGKRKRIIELVWMGD